MLAVQQDLVCVGNRNALIDRIPSELRSIPNWLRWKSVVRETGKKPTKIPIQTNGFNAATDDRNTWTSFEAVCAAKNTGCGIGFVIQEPYCVIDLDHSVDSATKQVAPWAQRYVDLCQSFTEFSPSGDGLHIWVKGHLPKKRYRHGNVEMYDSSTKRYMSVTGHLYGTITDIKEVDLGPVQVMMLEGADSKPTGVAHQGVDSAIRDNSAADFAFCCDLAKKGKNANQIDDAMRASTHMRPKWDERRGSQTYGERTIARALATSHDSPSPAKARRLNMSTASKIEPENITWLWKDILPIGKLTLFVGQPKKGKSFATVDTAARASTGGNWADEQKGNGQPIRTILISNEDAANDTVVPRLLAAGADLSKVEIVTGATCGSDDNLVFSLPEDVSSLETALNEFPDTKLVIIDPVMNHLGKIDALKDQDMRRALSPLAALAERKQVAIIVVTHFNKSTGGNILDKINGAVAMIGVARMGWAFVDDENDPKQRLMAMAGTNIASEETKALTYHFAPKDVVHKGKTLHTAEMVWGCSKTVNLTEVMIANESPKDYKSLRAKKWLPELFADGKPRLSREVYRAAEKLALPIDVDSIKRARKALGYGVKEDSSKSWWIVPPNATEDVEEEGGDGCSDWP